MHVKILLIIIIVLFFPPRAFSSETAVLKGRVIDVDGRPVKGAEVFIYNSNDIRRPADFISPKTDSEGLFGMTIPGGKYLAVSRLRSSEKYGPLLPGDKHSGEPVEIELERGKEFVYEFRVVDIKEAARMIKKTREDYFRLSGRAVDAHGLPVKDVYAIAYTGGRASEIPEHVSAWTGDDGRYTIFLPAGEYLIGYASVFPPDKDRGLYKKINVMSDFPNFDIIITPGISPTYPSPLPTGRAGSKGDG